MLNRYYYTIEFTIDADKERYIKLDNDDGYFNTFDGTRFTRFERSLDLTGLPKIFENFKDRLIWLKDEKLFTELKNGDLTKCYKKWSNVLEEFNLLDFDNLEVDDENVFEISNEKIVVNSYIPFDQPWCFDIGFRIFRYEQNIPLTIFELGEMDKLRDLKKQREILNVQIKELEQKFLNYNIGDLDEN